MLNKQDLSAIESLMDNKFKQELKPIKEDIQKIRADQKTIITFFDKEYLELRKRVELIENHLGISSRN